MNIYDEITEICKALLQTFPAAKLALEYANGRLSKVALERFCFGYFPNNDNLSLLSNAIGDEKLSEVGIVYDRIRKDGISTRIIRHATLEDHNLVLPYRDVYGNIVAIVGRTLLSESERGDISKYKNTSFDKGNHLFGLFEAKKYVVDTNVAYVVEGQFDCITAYDKGMKNVVALGSSNMTFNQFALLNRYTNNMILLLDNDSSGNAGMEKIVANFGAYANISIGIIPDGYKDIDQYLSENEIGDVTIKIR